MKPTKTNRAAAFATIATLIAGVAQFAVSTEALASSHRSVKCSSVPVAGKPGVFRVVCSRIRA